MSCALLAPQLAGVFLGAAWALRSPCGEDPLGAAVLLQPTAPQEATSVDPEAERCSGCSADEGESETEGLGGWCLRDGRGMVVSPQAVSVTVAGLSQPRKS